MEGKPNLRYTGRATSGWLGRLGLHDLQVLLAVLLVFATIWAFVELADEVIEGATASLDQTILLAMRNAADLSDPLGPGWLEEMGRDFTALGGVAVTMLISAVVVGYLLLVGRLRTALLSLGAVGGGLLLSTLLKVGFDRPRPDLVPHGSIVYTASFPSGHSMMSAVVYLTLAALLIQSQGAWRTRTFILLVAVLLTVLVGVSRVYLGVHWPTDVLAGWTAGAAWACLCWLLTRFLQRCGQVEQPAEDTDPERP